MHSAHLPRVGLATARMAPVAHAFGYRLFMLYLDLAELDDVFRGRWLWSTRRPALAWLRRADYLGDPRDAARRGGARRVEPRRAGGPTGPIRLLTHLRYFGYCFNPVSFYYCFDARRPQPSRPSSPRSPTRRGASATATCCDGRVGTRDGGGCASGSARRSTSRRSCRWTCEYDWRSARPASALGVHMATARATAQRVFDATLALRRREITGRDAGRLLAALSVA